MEDSELSAGTGEQKKSDRSRSMSLHGLMVALIAAAAVITHMSSGSKQVQLISQDVSMLFPPLF